MFKSYLDEDVKVQKVKKIWKLKFPNELALKQSNNPKYYYGDFGNLYVSRWEIWPKDWRGEKKRHYLIQTTEPMLSNASKWQNFEQHKCLPFDSGINQSICSFCRVMNIMLHI